MNRLKILLPAIFILALPSFSFANLNVVTTTSDLAAIAKEVGGDKIDVLSIAKGYQDPHFVDAKPSYLLKLKKADLFVQVGLELEVGWAPPLLSNARNPKILPGNRGFLDVSEGCDILEKKNGVDRAQGDVHPFGNPHYLLDPENGRVVAKTITARISELDPAHAAEFQANLAKFEAKLTDKEKDWAAVAAPLKGSKVIFYHNSWSNFEKRFGVTAADFIEPKPGIPPSPAHIEALVKLIKSEGIKVILVEPYFDTKLPEKLAADTGSKMVSFPPSVGAVPEIATYTDLFDYDLKALSGALGEKIMDAFQILLWPFVACLILTGIHAYLGLHVVERGVIFVDLSLAQVAALGSACALLAGYDPHQRAAYFFSLGFTLLGAAIFAMTRSKKSKIPQEAFIGITYAVSAAAAVLIMDRLPEGGEHIKHILVGNLLAVSKPEILKMALIYSFVGLLHWKWRKPLLAISTDHNAEIKGEHGYNVRLWDFVFYATFGFVVTSSVAIAGVLLVFSFLIVPPVTAMLFTRKIWIRLAFGWIMGVIVSFLGIYGSYQWDTPTGATVVCMFGAALLLMGLLRAILFTNRIKMQNKSAV